jgi:peptidoglycan/LPS O-acetylase OafA/YrhL
VIPPIWSLYVEVLFYLLLPAFVAVARRRPIILSMSAFVVLTLSDPLGPRELDLWRFFFVGIIVSELQQRFQRTVTEPLALIVFAAGLWVFVADLYHASYDNFDWLAYQIEQLVPAWRLTGTYPNYTLGLALGIGLLMLGANWSRLLNRFFSLYPWRFLAAVSYSVFMWHGFLIISSFLIRFDGRGDVQRLAAMPAPLAGWVLPLVVIPAILGVATLSYLLVERPFLLLKRRRPGRAGATPPLASLAEANVAAPTTQS